MHIYDMSRITYILKMLEHINLNSERINQTDVYIYTFKDHCITWKWKKKKNTPQKP